MWRRVYLVQELLWRIQIYFEGRWLRIFLTLLPFAESKKKKKNQETQILKKLTKDPDIIIIRADKGNKICILDKILYNKKVMDILSETHIYKPIKSDPSDKFTREARKQLEIYQLKDLLLHNRAWSIYRPADMRVSVIIGYQEKEYQLLVLFLYFVLCAT